MSSVMPAIGAAPLSMKVGVAALMRRKLLVPHVVLAKSGATEIEKSSRASASRVWKSSKVISLFVPSKKTKRLEPPAT